MENKKVLTIVGGVLLCAFSFLTGLGLGIRVSRPHIDSDFMSIIQSDEVAHKIGTLPPGTVLEIEVAHGRTPMREYREGEVVGIRSRKWYNRMLSWWGLGGPEAAAMDQGISPDGGGTSAVIGRSYGYGALERLWSRIKSLFWFFSFTGLILVVLLFIPATAPIAGALLRFFGSAIPFIGSLIERIFSGFKWKKPLAQTVCGGQEFKKLVRESTHFTDEQKAEIKALFNMAMQTKQDGDAQKTVKEIKSNGVS